MDKRLIGYVVLGSCDELIAWQKKNKGFDILSIVPMISGLKMQFEGQIIEGRAEREHAEGITGIGAFVTFAYPHEEDKERG